MTKEQLKRRTKLFAIETAKLLVALPYSIINKNYSNQLIRSSSSVGANYRAALRAKSKADFINKLKIVEEELDESIYFLELLSEFNEAFIPAIHELCREGNELLSIIVASLRTLRQANRKP